MRRGMTFPEAYTARGKMPIYMDGEYKSITEWCRIYGVNKNKVTQLMKDGLKPQDAILTARMRLAEEKRMKEMKIRFNAGELTDEEREEYSAYCRDKHKRRKHGLEE